MDDIFAVILLTYGVFILYAIIKVNILRDKIEKLEIRILNDEKLLVGSRSEQAKKGDKIWTTSCSG